MTTSYFVFCFFFFTVRESRDLCRCNSTLLSDPFRTSDRIYAAGSAAEIIIAKRTPDLGAVNYSIIKRTFKILCVG